METKQIKEFHKATKAGYGKVEILRNKYGDKITDISYTIKYESYKNRNYYKTYNFNDYKTAYRKYDELIKHILKMTEERPQYKYLYNIRTAFQNMEIPVQKIFYEDFKEKLNSLEIEWFEYETEGVNYKYKTLIPKDKYNYENRN